MFSRREHALGRAVLAKPPASAGELAVRYKTADRRVILYAGTFEAYQGLDLLAEAAPQVLGARPATAFLCVGGKETQIAALRKQASANGSEPGFVFPGVVRPEDLEAHFALADVLVSLRVSGTNTPLKIYSYMRSGVPILATNVRSHTQVLTPDVALLVEPHADAIAAGILHLLQDQGLAQCLSQNARKLAQEMFSPEAYYTKVAEVYAFLETQRRSRKS